MPLGIKKIGEKAPDESWREAYARHLPSVVREDAEQERAPNGEFAGSGGGDAKAARIKSKTANKSSDRTLGQGNDADGHEHERSAELHQAAASAHAAVGNHEQAALHQEAAEQHLNLASTNTQSMGWAPDEASAGRALRQAAKFRKTAKESVSKIRELNSKQRGESATKEDADEQPRDEKGQFASNGGGALVSAAHASFRKNTTEAHAAYANASPRQFGPDHPSMQEHSAYGKAQAALASRSMSPQERVAEYEKTHSEEKQAFDKYMAASKTSGALSSADNPIHQLARDREARGAPDTRMLELHPDVQQARAAHEFAASRERQAEDRRVIEARAKNFPGEKPGRVGVTTNSITGLKEKPSETFEQHWARHQENAAAKAAVSPAARMKAEELTGQAREASDTAKRLLTNAKKMPGALIGGIGAHATAQIVAAHTAAAQAHSVAADAHEDVGNKNQASKHRREAAQHVERAATPSVFSKAIR